MTRRKREQTVYCVIQINDEKPIDVSLFNNKDLAEIEAKLIEQSDGKYLYFSKSNQSVIVPFYSQNMKKDQEIYIVVIENFKSIFLTQDWNEAKTYWESVMGIEYDAEDSLNYLKIAKKYDFPIFSRFIINESKEDFIRIRWIPHIEDFSESNKEERYKENITSNIISDIQIPLNNQFKIIYYVGDLESYNIEYELMNFINHIFITPEEFYQIILYLDNKAVLFTLIKDEDFNDVLKRLYEYNHDWIDPDLVPDLI